MNPTVFVSRNQRRIDFNLMIGLPHILLSCGTATVGTLLILWITQAHPKSVDGVCHSALPWIWAGLSFALIIIRNVVYIALKRAQIGKEPGIGGKMIKPIQQALVQERSVNFGVAIPQRVAMAVSFGLIWGVAGAWFLEDLDHVGHHLLIMTLVTLTFTSMPSLYASSWGFSVLWASVWLPILLVDFKAPDASEFVVGALAILAAGSAVSMGIRMAIKQMMKRHSAYIEEVIDSRKKAIETEALATATANMAHQHKMFLLGAGHDLAQPIHTMLNCLGSFEKRIDDLERFGGPLLSMRTAATVLQRLCQDIIHLEKINSGLHKAETKPIHLQALFDRVTDQTMHLAKGKGLTLWHRATNVAIKTDPFLLERILRNLVENAIRYTRHGGVCVAARKSGEFINIEVWDSGAGISESGQQRLFEVFERGENPGPQKGYGLGLSIVKGLATSIGATITVKSIPGKGSRFRLSLPKSDIDPAELEAADIAPPPPSINGMWVALVEDNDNLRASLVDYLRGEGANVIAAKDSATMTELLNASNEHIDTLVTDWNLRGETGQDAFKALLKAVPGFYPTWVVISAAIHPEMAGEIQARGVPVLMKPVEPTVLRDAIARSRLKISNTD
ncbi:ATP-binding response regulator [Noviherbaspirillum pedocola]|uniref:histidine kinase n=1 Tax=Noviherbaspirillum pedocola TaxID=2801341 RepID=A0A934SWN7_9BURK|nr:HAMP domain-containing sensor histidine kinase [Noviherbaspirillum pedocola]MBK4737955.1 response regulator [Noviherbaspirillum pedocola]